MSALPAEKLREESGDQTVDGFEYREDWQVLTTSASDDAGVVMAAANLPILGQTFTSDGLSRVTSRRPNRDSNVRTRWTVEILYAREKASQEDKQQPPTLRPVRRSTGTKWVEKPLMRDNTRTAAFPNGKPILTSAKTPFNPPPTISVPHPTATFVRWENSSGANSFSTQVKIDYEGKVNSAQFGNFLSGYVMCTSINGTEQWEQDGSGNLVKYWEVTYEFEYNPDAWNPWRPLDADFWFIDPADGKRKPIYVDKDGTYGGPELLDDAAKQAVPVPTPVPLSGPYDAVNNPDGSLGRVLQASELPDHVHYLEYDNYLEADFNALGLPVN